MYESACYQVCQLVWKAVRQLHIFDAFLVAAAAVSDDHVHIVRRDISATNVAVIIVFAVEWTDVGFSHILLALKLLLSYTARAVPNRSLF